MCCDECEFEDDEADIAAIRASHASGEPRVPHEQLLAEYGLL